MQDNAHDRAEGSPGEGRPALVLGSIFARRPFPSPIAEPVESTRPPDLPVLAPVVPPPPPAAEQARAAPPAPEPPVPHLAPPEAAPGLDHATTVPARDEAETLPLDQGVPRPEAEDAGRASPWPPNPDDVETATEPEQSPVEPEAPAPSPETESAHDFAPSSLPRADAEAPAEPEPPAPVPFPDAGSVDSLAPATRLQAAAEVPAAPTPPVEPESPAPVPFPDAGRADSFAPVFPAPADATSPAAPRSPAEPETPAPVPFPKAGRPDGFTPLLAARPDAEAPAAPELPTEPPVPAPSSETGTVRRFGTPSPVRNASEASSRLPFWRKSGIPTAPVAPPTHPPVATGTAARPEPPRVAVLPDAEFGPPPLTFRFAPETGTVVTFDLSASQNEAPLSSAPGPEPRRQAVPSPPPVPDPLPAAQARSRSILFAPSGVAAATRPGRGRIRLLRQILSLLLALVLLGGGVAYTWVRYGQSTLYGVISAPLVTLYAAEDGHVMQVAAAAGTRLTPGREILTIRGEHPDESVRNDLSARLQAAQDRVAGIDQLVAELGRQAAEIRGRKQDSVSARDLDTIQTRLAALRAQHDQASGETDTLQRDLVDEEARLAGTTPQDVASDRDAVLWTLLATDGMTVKRGTPVAQIADCSHLYVAPQGALLRPGATVRVRLGGAPEALIGQVRTDQAPPGPPSDPLSATSAGASAAGQKLMVEVDATALQQAAGDACPIGRSVTMVPDAAPSGALAGPMRKG